MRIFRSKRAFAGAQQYQLIDDYRLFPMSTLPDMRLERDSWSACDCLIMPRLPVSGDYHTFRAKRLISFIQLDLNLAALQPAGV